MQSHRFEELEGLRGVAAVMVAVYHFLMAFYVVYFFGEAATGPQHMRLEDNLYGNPLGVFTSGTFAVAIFFVLSGFVLSIGFFRSKSVDSIKKLALKRYPRLMLPALASTLIAFIIMTLGIAMIQQVGALTGSHWLTKTWTFIPDLWNAIYSGAYGIFVQSGSVYNNVLWTMTIEFAGSFLVFGFMALFGTFKYRWIGYGFLLIATFNTWFLAFVLGMLLADLYASGRIMQRKRRWLTVAPVLIAALYLGGYPMMGDNSSPFYGFLSPLGLAIDYRTLYLTIGATLLVGAVVTVSQISHQFAKKRFSVLGRYTFSLYLVHLLVLYTFGMWIFMLLRDSFGLNYNVSALLSIIASIPIVGAATFLFERYVDAPSVVLSSKIANFLLNPDGTLEWRKVIQKYSLARYGRRLKRRLLRLTPSRSAIVEDENLQV